MEAAHPSSARVVDEQVETLVAAKDGGDQGACLGALRNVNLSHVHVRRPGLAAVLRDIVQAVYTPCRELEARAVSREGKGGGRSNAARGTCDYHHGSLQPHFRSVGSA